MALGNPLKRKSLFSSSRKGKSMAQDLKRGKFGTAEARKGKSLSSDLKKKKQKVGRPSSSSKKKAATFQESKACPIFVKLIDAGTVADHEPVFYMRRKDNSVMKEGRITREGVLCRCCKQLFLISNFEVHAGSTLHRPSANMFLRDGRSIMECLYACDGLKGCNDIARRRRQSSSHDVSEDKNDNACQICGDGGELMLCDSCPSAFHYDCLQLDAVPEGEVWHCSRCRCGSCGLGKMENGQDGSSMLSCAQCHIPYHQSCVSRPHDTAAGLWFCTKTCQNIFEKLRRLVDCSFPLGGGLSWMVLQASEEENESAVNAKKQLGEALEVLQQCFDPIKDQETGVDVLSQVVFNKTSHVKRLDCSGFYTIVLMREEKMMSVATIRTHGKSLAEMPFVGTGYEFRQQGMCKALMQALETMLRGAGVYKLILPSINDVVETWTGSFGFRCMSSQDRKQFSGTSHLSFPGTTLLSKRLFGPGVRKRAEPTLDVRTEVRRRSVIESKEKLVPSKKAMSSFQPISCH